MLVCESVDVQASTAHLSLTSICSCQVVLQLTARCCECVSELRQSLQSAQPLPASEPQSGPSLRRCCSRTVPPPPSYGVSWYSCFIVECLMGGVLGGQSQSLFIAASLRARGLCIVSVFCRGLWRGQEVNREGHLDPGCVCLLETSDS